MTAPRIATPFGRRTMTLGLIAAEMTARDVAPETTVHKWRVFEWVSRARLSLGLGDRAMAVLQALLSFHPETALGAGDRLIVHPSNRALAERAHGLAPATLRRQLAALVEAGLILRRDSPNGKRFIRKGADGAAEAVFGFDLVPLVARAAELAGLAEAVEAERRATKRLRERISLARRDIAKMLDLASGEGRPAADPAFWAAARAEFAALVAPLRRILPGEALAGRADSLDALADRLAKAFETFINSHDMSANESSIERHQQIQDSDPFELEPAFREDHGAGRHPAGTGGEEATGARTLPLGLVLEACPDLHDYGPLTPEGGRRIRDWGGLIRTAGEVRPMLGISPDAWAAAREAFGLVEASVLIAAILQKGDAVRFPGGYLRALTAQKLAGTFSLGPVLMALVNTRHRRRAPPA